MARLAWFSPVPPSRSGIAAYSAEILPRLAARHQVDAFTSPLVRDHARPAGHPAVFEAHDFAWKHFTAPYDLVVYQLGNAACHDFIWPHLFRYPGLVVLHDAQLHHARARMLLARGLADEYTAEFHANHPDAPDGSAELVIRDLADHAYYLWPMIRLVLQSARHAAVHSPRLAATLAGEHGLEVDAIRMGVDDGAAASGPRMPAGEEDGRRAIRARHGVAADAVVLAAFGLVTPEKGLATVLDVLRALPRAHLMLVGETAAHFDALASARALGVADRVSLTGYVSDDQVAGYLAAADVCLCLRWPTGRETSASWLRALAAGRPTVVTSLAHSDETASYDPRTWAAEPAGSGGAASDPVPDPVAVAVDILDERHSLELALRRLVTDGALRDALGRSARRHWARFHTLACMAEDYERVLDRALARPVLRMRGLPPHLEADGTARAARLAAHIGVTVDFLRRDPPSDRDPFGPRA
jgi:glycosyltransferase involved in cell wall biosynthesis